MLVKSLLGYATAFVVAIVVYKLVTRSLESRFNRTEDPKSPWWVVAQWCSTGFLWSQWLIQDLANIYVFLPRDPVTRTPDVAVGWFMASIAVILALLAFIFYTHGGAIQKVVLTKTNTTDIRSATFVDLIYGIVLFLFKEVSNIPMSTTWVFVGLLAGARSPSPGTRSTAAAGGDPAGALRPGQDLRRPRRQRRPRPAAAGTAEATRLRNTGFRRPGRKGIAMPREDSFPLGFPAPARSPNPVRTGSDLRKHGPAVSLRFAVTSFGGNPP